MFITWLKPILKFFFIYITLFNVTQLRVIKFYVNIAIAAPFYNAWFEIITEDKIAE